MNTPTPSHDELVAAIKAEVLERMREGTIPEDVKSFSDLHDYCDANCLGGLCESKTFDALWSHFAGSESVETMPQGMLDLINKVQETVHAWLACGTAETEISSN